MKKLLTLAFAVFIFISGLGLYFSNNVPDNTVQPVPVTAITDVTTTTTTPVNDVTTQTPAIQPPQNTANSNSTSQATPSTACVVTISGKQYDVTKLKRTHSGGNVFTCGTDMTNSYFSMHSQSMLNNQMSKYLIK